MSNYEHKLGKWLKYVQQQVEAVGGAVKEGEPQETPKPEAEPPEAQDQPDSVVVRDRLGRALASEAAEVETASVMADSSLLDERPELLERRPAVFDDTDIPDVEDYLPFLREPELAPEPPPERDQGSLFVSEGTGEPKPVVREPEKPEISREQVRPEPAQRALRRDVAPPAAPELGEVRNLWDQLPRHIQLLVGQYPKEIPQHSYKKFKETREELVARLLDPPLTLEETARVLNVCPTTVRRYTNRGALTHFRTAGNQRRFRLSDVLAFLESTAHPAWGPGSGAWENPS